MHPSDPAGDDMWDRFVRDRPFADAEPPRPARSLAHWLAAGVVLAFGVTTFVTCARSTVTGSLLPLALFSLPLTALGATLAFTPGRTLHGRTARITTTVLCVVLLANPALLLLLPLLPCLLLMVYLTAHGLVELIDKIRQQWRDSLID